MTNNTEAGKSISNLPDTRNKKDTTIENLGDTNPDIIIPEAIPVAEIVAAPASLSTQELAEKRMREEYGIDDLEIKTWVKEKDNVLEERSQNYYEFLGVSEDITQEELKKQMDARLLGIEKKIKEKNLTEDKKGELTKEQIRLTQIYLALEFPGKKEQYDRKLKAEKEMRVKFQEAILKNPEIKDAKEIGADIRQEEAMARCRAFIKEEFENNPDGSSSKLTRWIDDFGSKYKFGKEQRNELFENINKRIAQREKVNAFMVKHSGEHNLSDPNDRTADIALVKKLTGKELSQEEASQIKISADSMAIVIEANGAITEKLYSKSGDPKETDRCGGFHKKASKDAVDLVAINRDAKRSADNPYATGTVVEKIQEHEKQHAENRLLSNMFEKDDRKQLLEDYQKADKKHKKNALENYLREEQRVALAKISDEILASLHDQGAESIRQRWQNLFLNPEKLSSYDFLKKIRESKEYGIGSKIAIKDEGDKESNLSQKIFEEEYQKTIQGAVGALYDLINAGGFDNPTAIEFLARRPISSWHQKVGELLNEKVRQKKEEGSLEFDLSELSEDFKNAKDKKTLDGGYAWTENAEKAADELANKILISETAITNLTGQRGKENALLFYKNQKAVLEERFNNLQELVAKQNETVDKKAAETKRENEDDTQANDRARAELIDEIVNANQVSKEVEDRVNAIKKAKQEKIAKEEQQQQKEEHRRAEQAEREEGRRKSKALEDKIIDKIAADRKLKRYNRKDFETAKIAEVAKEARNERLDEIVAQKWDALDEKIRQRHKNKAAFQKELENQVEDDWQSLSDKGINLSREGVYGLIRRGYDLKSIGEGRLSRIGKKLGLLSEKLYIKKDGVKIHGNDFYKLLREGEIEEQDKIKEIAKRKMDERWERGRKKAKEIRNEAKDVIKKRDAEDFMERRNVEILDFKELYDLLTEQRKTDLVDTIKLQRRIIQETKEKKVRQDAIEKFSKKLAVADDLKKAIVGLLTREAAKV